MSGMNWKCCSFYLVKHVCIETANNNMWHSVVLSHIHLLIIFANVLTPQPTEQFCLYCSNTYGGHCILTSILFTFCGYTIKTVIFLHFIYWPHSLRFSLPHCNTFPLFTFFCFVLFYLKKWKWKLIFVIINIMTTNVIRAELVILP